MIAMDVETENELFKTKPDGIARQNRLKPTVGCEPKKLEAIKLF